MLIGRSFRCGFVWLDMILSGRDSVNLSDSPAGMPAEPGLGAEFVELLGIGLHEANEILRFEDAE